MRWLLFSAFLLLSVLPMLHAAEPMADAEGYYSLFDGKTLDGWKAAENPNVGKVENGELIIGGGPRGHLFYDGPVNKHDFKNFEFKAQVKIVGNSNSGIYFHTAFQEKDWPSKGFEAQVCSQKYKDPRKTGSLYAVKDVMESPAKDDEWFDYYIKVSGKNVTIQINGKTTIEFTQEDGKLPNDKMPGRVLSHGTFALQGHDPKSVVHYKNLRVKPLAD
jgi:hypothetical protein